MELASNSKGEVSVLADTTSPSSSSDLQKNKQIPGISYVLILKSKTKTNTTKFQFDCVLCNPEEELFDGVKMRTHVRSRKHLMSVLELDNHAIFENVKNDTVLTDAELFHKVCNFQSDSQSRSVATQDTFKLEREKLRNKVVQRQEAFNKIPVSENLPNSDRKTELKIEKNSSMGSSPKKSSDVIINNVQSFMEELNKKQIGRHPTKIVFISDGRNEDLTPDKFGGGVQVVKSIKMNLGNVLQNLEKFKLLGKGSMFIVLCGVYSLVSFKVVDDCKTMKCQKQLLKYTINWEVSSDILISKALNLHSYILNKTSNDTVMFCDIVPLNVFKDTVSKCNNNHTLENNISSAEYVKYFRILDEYNAFIEDHTRTMGLKNWRLLTNSFPLTDFVSRPLKTTYDYNKIDYPQALSYIVRKSKELLNSLRQVSDVDNLNALNKSEQSDDSKSTKGSKATPVSTVVKPSIQARLLSSSKQIQDARPSATQVNSNNEIKSQEEQKQKKSYEEFISRIESIASKQKDRQPSEIVFALDPRYNHFSLKMDDFKDNISIRRVFSFENARTAVGNGSLIVALFGGYTLVSTTVLNICKIKKCSEPLRKRRINMALTSRSLIDKALKLHEYALASTQNNKVMFTELNPMVSSGNTGCKCVNGHFFAENFPLKIYRTYLNIIDEYNEFVRYHSQIMGYKNWDLVKNSYPTRDNTALSTQEKYDYQKIDCDHLSEYISKCTKELLHILKLPKFKLTSDVVTESLEIEVKLQELGGPMKKRSCSLAQTLVPMQKNRNPNQILLVTDNEALSLKTKEFGESVKVIKISGLTFGNAFEYLNKKDALDKGSIILIMCGINSLINKDIVGICKEKKCTNPLIKYSVIPNITGSSLISKALALQANILKKTSNDQVIFGDLLPVDISNPDTKVCNNAHSYKNIIHKDIVAIYEKAISEYNEFVEEHCQLFGFKNFLSQKSDSGNSLDIDIQLLSDSISTGIRELVKSLQQTTPQVDANEKSVQEHSVSATSELPLESATDLPETSIAEQMEKEIEEPSQIETSAFEEFKSKIENLALMQKDRQPNKIILALDVSYKQCNLKTNEFGDNVTLKNVFNFERAVYNLKNILGKSSLIIALIGGYSVASPIDVDICRKMKCSKPVRRHRINTKLTVRSLIKNALNFHEYVLQNTEKDEVMFTELTPLVSFGRNTKTCEKKHMAFENIPLNIYTNYLNIIDEYNKFVHYHSQVMGYKKWNIVKNSYPSLGTTLLSSNYKYNYLTVDYMRVSEHIISCVSEAYTNLSQQKEPPSEEQEKSTDVLSHVQESQKYVSINELSSNTNPEISSDEKRSLRVDTLLCGAKMLIPLQEDRSPSQVLFVTDHETLSLRTDKFGGYVKVAKFTHINLESTFQSLKKRNLLGRGSIIVLMCGIQSLIRVSAVEDCKKMKCLNSLMSYSIIPAMTGSALITKALALHERILNETENDQVMFCELIPVNISGSDTRVCGNNHRWKKIIHKDIYAAYPKAIEEYNEFVAKHCKMFGFKNFCLFEKVFLDRNDSTTQPALEDVDVDLLSNTVCTGIDELLEILKDEMKKRPDSITPDPVVGELATKPVKVEVSVEQKPRMSSMPYAEAKPSIADKLLMGAKKLIQIQKDRHPSQILFVTDHEALALTLRADKFDGYVKVAKYMHINLESTFQSLKKRNVLGRGSIIVLMCGIQSLIRVSVVEDCKKMKCLNSLMSYSIIPAMTGSALITKALALHERILNETANDQVMFCELIPVNISGSDTRVCGNNHRWKRMIHKDIYAGYRKAIEEYNEFVAKHCQMFGFKNLCLFEKLFLDSNDSITQPVLEDVDLDHLSNTVCTGINELLDTHKIQMKKHPNLTSLDSTGNEPPTKRVKAANVSGSQTYTSSTLSTERFSEIKVETSVPKKVFDKILLITSKENSKKRDLLRQDRVHVIVNHAFSSNEIILLIRKAMEFHAGRILYLLDTGILGIGHQEDYVSCVDCNSPCRFPLSVLVPDEESFAKYTDVIDNTKRSLQSLITKVNSVLNNGSAFCILPPSPPVLVDVSSVSDHFLFHNIELEEMETEVYFATYKSINNIKTAFTRYSKALLSFLLSEVSKFGISDRTFRDYNNNTAHWDYHINAVTYHTFVQSSINIVGSRYSMWLSAVNNFANDCLDLHSSEISKWKLKEPIVNISGNQQRNGNDSIVTNLKSHEMFSGSSKPDNESGFYDHVVFIGFCPKQIGLFPREEWISEKFSLITVKTQFNWNDVKQKLTSINALGSFKSILFVIIGSIKLLANELNVSYCIKMKCRETLTYLNSGSLPVDRLAYNSMKKIYELISKIERYFMGRSDIVLLPLPTLCTKVSKVKHELLHQTSGEVENPYIVLGEKERWDQAAEKYKILWEKEMYQLFGKAKESMRYFMPKLVQFSDTMSFVYWIDIGSDFADFGTNEIQKYKQFLKNLVSVANPSLRRDSPSDYSEQLKFSNTQRETHNKSVTRKNYSQTLPISQKITDYEESNTRSKKVDYSRSHQKTYTAEVDISKSLDTTKVLKTPSKPMFEHVYIVGKKELNTLLNMKSLNNVEFIQFEQDKFIESEISTLTKKLGNYKNNSVCLLVLDILGLATEFAVSPSCKQFGCETPISVMSLNIGVHMDETAIHSYALNKIMNVMSFVSRCSLYVPVIIMPFFPASIFCDDGFFSINHKISHFIKNSDSYVAHGRKETWECFESLASTMWTSIMRSNNGKYFSKDQLDKFVAKSSKNLIFEENVNKLNSSCSEISNWRYMLEVNLGILLHDSYGKEMENIPRNVAGNSHRYTEAVRMESGGSSRENSKVLAPVKVKGQQFLVVVWNSSSKDEGTIINTFKNADPQCDVHTYEDHYQFGISVQDTEEVFDISKFLKSVDCNIRICVIGENERFVVKYKTQMCDGSCHGNQKRCSFYHNQDDRRRIPYSENSMLYKNGQCSYRAASKGCVHGDKCSYSHTNYEVDYHPLNYQSSLCGYKEVSLCVNQPWCNFAHKYTSEMFYNKDWEHLVGYGPESSLKFIIGAIRGFRKPNSMRRRKKAILLSSSIKFLNVVKTVILSLLKEINIKVIIAGETTIDADNYDVILGTPSHIANYNWNLVTRTDVRALVVDDVLTLLNDSDSEFLFSIIDHYKLNKDINKVYVCEIYDANAVEVLSEILETPLKEAKLSEYSGVKLNVAGTSATEIKKKDLSANFETRQPYSGSQAEATSRPRIRAKRSRSSSPFRNKKQRSSSPREPYSQTKSSETKTNSRARRRSRSRERSSSREKKKFSFGYQRRASRSRSKDRKNDSRTQDRKLRSRRSKSPLKFQQQTSAYDNQSSSLQPSLAPSTSYHDEAYRQQTSFYNSGEVAEEFTVEGTLSLLEQISSKIGMLGPAISEIARVARDKGVDSRESLNIFADDETVTLLQLVVDKLKVLSKSGPLSDVSLMTKAFDWILKLMDYAKNPPKMDADLNLKAIASASMHKEPSYTLDLIKNAYVYVKKQEPTKEELNEIYFKVCSLHFEMALKDGK